MIRSRTTRRKQKHTPRWGAVLVEFALAAPITFVMVFALIEFSRVAMLTNTAENAAYEGCRAAIIPGGTADKARTAALRLMNSVGAVSPTITVTPATITEATNEVTVTVSLSLNSNAWLIPSFTRNQTLIKRCKLTRESASF
jgi:Flp pilus assembly protein TadG